VSRIERNFPKRHDVPVEAEDILEELEVETSRTDAVVRYFSAGEGWQEASAELRGAFAASEFKK
jgi:ABC-type phosphonate transport system ATPase subunit